MFVTGRGNKVLVMGLPFAELRMVGNSIKTAIVAFGTIEFDLIMGPNFCGG